MIDAHSNLGHNESQAVCIYLYSYLIASYKLQIVLTLQITANCFLFLIRSPLSHHDNYLSVFCTKWIKRSVLWINGVR